MRAERLIEEQVTGRLSINTQGQSKLKKIKESLMNRFVFETTKDESALKHYISAATESTDVIKGPKAGKNSKILKSCLLCEQKSE